MRDQIQRWQDRLERRAHLAARRNFWIILIFVLTFAGMLALTTLLLTTH